MRFNIITSFNAEEIIQEIQWDEDTDPRLQVAREIIRLKEQGIKEALIKLGWTPPGEKCEHCCKK